MAKALNDHDLAKAMIASVLLRLPELDWGSAIRIANAENALQKYPGQPRGWHQYWSTGKEDDQSGNLDDAAYNGKYHDIVVQEVAAYWRSRGGQK